MEGNSAADHALSSDNAMFTGSAANSVNEGTPSLNYIRRSDLKEFSHQYMLKVDVDSIYFGYKSLGSLMEGFGVSVKSFVDSRKSRLDNSSSSRFGLSLKNGDQKVKIDVSGIEPDKIRLDYIPNIEIMKCRVNDISPMFYINMFFVGIAKTRPTTYFNNLELKAITALLNKARERTIMVLTDSAKHQTTDNQESIGMAMAAQVQLESFSDMCLFESITGGTQDRRIKNKQTCLSNDNAIIFGNSFDRELKNFADCGERDFNEVFSSRSYVGSDVTNCRHTLRRELAEMRKFVKQLSKGVFFCASCAGCKRDFNEKKGCQKLMAFDSRPDHIGASLHNFYQECDNLQKKALDNLKQLLFGERDRMREEDDENENDELPFRYNIDIGIEISPMTVGDSFFLKGKRARDVAKMMLKERWIEEDGRRTRYTSQEGLNLPDGENPHTMLSNLVPNSEDSAILNMGIQLDISNGEVFNYGSTDEMIGEEEEFPSSVAGGKISKLYILWNDTYLDTKKKICTNYIPFLMFTENNHDRLEVISRGSDERGGVVPDLNLIEHFIHGQENDFRDTHYIHPEDLAENSDDAPNSVLSLYNQFDTRGEIGGVHSGRVLLKTVKEGVQHSAAENTSNDGIINIKNFESNKIITGLCMYNPKIKQNGMVS